MLGMQNTQGACYENYPLARHTAWRVGGSAQYAYHPENVEDLQRFLRQLPGECPVTWLGLGSNVLIRDGGVPGVVIFTLKRLKNLTLDSGGLIRAEAGVTCSKLSKLCVKHGFEKGAFFAGIPGTVGGALRMNAGAFGGETWPHVFFVQTIDRAGVIRKRTPDDFQIAYRHVVGVRDEFFLAGYFKFQPGDTNRTQNNLRQLLKQRSDSQPIGTYNCGSVFRNPPGDFAARLIESAGLKSYTVGDACVSEKHANFILNKGAATAADIEAVIKAVAGRVYQKHGVMLEQEVVILGSSA